MSGSFVGTDGDGTRATVALEGRGSLFAQIVDGQLFLSTKQTNGRSVLSIVAKGGDGYVSLGGALLRGTLNTFSAPAANLTGELRSTSDLGNLHLNQATQSVIEATRFGTIAIAGAVDSTRIVVLPLDDSPAIGSLVVGGAFEKSSVLTLGDIRAVELGSMRLSLLGAGLAARSGGFHYLPTGTASEPYTNFTGKYSIASVIVGGRKNLSFDNSIIAAETVGTVQLKDVSSRLSPNTFGIATNRLGSVRVLSKRMPAQFKVSQFAKPVVVSVATGTYYGAYLSGTNSAGFVSVHLGGTSYIGNGFTLPTSIPTDGLQIGSVKQDGVENLLVLLRTGEYAVQANGTLLHRAGDLALTLSSLFSGQKINVFGTNDSLSMRHGSTGPIVKFVINPDGYTFAANESHGEVLIPPLKRVIVRLNARGVATTVWDKEPVLVSPGNVFSVGNVFDPAWEAEIVIADDLKYHRTSETGYAYDGLPFNTAETRRGGTDRLPAQVSQDGGKLYYRGDSRGGTVVLGQLGQIVLNSTGEVLTIPTYAQLRAQLTP